MEKLKKTMKGAVRNRLTEVTIRELSELTKKSMVQTLDETWNAPREFHVDVYISTPTPKKSKK